MFGFLFGTACLVGLFWVLRGGRRGGCHGWYGRHRHYGGHHDARSRSSWMLRWLFERLDTTPGQEKAIRSAVDELLEELHGVKRTVQDSRADVARAMRGDEFNAEILGEVFARHDGAIDGLRKAGVGALAKVHDVLDPEQRSKLADLLESMRGRGSGGPYRSWAG